MLGRVGEEDTARVSVRASLEGYVQVTPDVVEVSDECARLSVAVRMRCAVLCVDVRCFRDETRALASLLASRKSSAKVVVRVSQLGSTDDAVSRVFFGGKDCDVFFYRVRPRAEYALSVARGASRKGRDLKLQVEF